MKSGEFFIFGSVLAILLSSCVHASYPRIPEGDGSVQQTSAIEKIYRETVSSLKEDLASLGEHIDEDEAWLVAKTAVYYSMHLANVYGVVRPALLHNVLVNAHIKERGLCVHWTEDLMNKLRSLNLKSFRIYWGVAHRNELFRVEHSTVVVSAQGQMFEEGIVLDPWRDSGRIFWTAVKNDRYPWKELKPE